ncbi:uncharacterized protein LOC107404341 [Ziziphus jujuba]|uniref:Uncharacterized protein LOC107404341 n=2 Tax=Ziziphus jujuba TaxID=326968 RepID=A0A6P3Z797_ZIZJJ|nr:uncharacterized protein LOC107404341 [Ziziphus jujuba]KAH7542191.1 hypothetical protein FEM48_Zijuj02G0047000 [Ziziphus jujuba var. spinosa]
MASYNQTTGFRYNLNSDAISVANGDAEFSGILEIYVHHARNIHNICIYENQDVYAKFSLTYNPDETLTTRIINRGGKNPDFNENLRMKITQPDAVLKCEIWMLSRARNYMEDQLLGFALVPISKVVENGKMTEDYSLSSTDLFHSPAGTVQLTLSLDKSLPINPSLNPLSESSTTSSITSEVILLDRKISEVILDPVEYSRIEFPDINVVRENQQMVSEYFDLASHVTGSKAASCGVASFLHLGSSPQPADDYEMTANSSEDNHGDPISPNESIQNSGFFSSTTTSLSDDRNSADSIEKKNRAAGESSNSGNASITNEAANQGCNACPDTPTSKKGRDAGDEKDSNFSSKEDQEKNNNCKEGNKIGSAQFGQVFSAPLGNINLEAEQSAMQQQIVDMYMRSMQQFTESLAKMKLPMELGKPERPADHGEIIRNHNNNIELDKKKDGSRVFYGSRAFF